MSHELKTKRKNTGSRNQLPDSGLKLLLAVCCLPLILASCATARHGTLSYTPSETPSAEAEELTAGKPPEPEKEKRSFAFQQFRGDRRQIIASWYGPDFHGKPTSSGEPFNMYALTCAHKQYPFGTKLRVINTQNLKEVECTVNDRGPFIAGRDLDLSYAAARKIDLIGPGTGPVVVEPLGRDLRYVKYIRYGSSSGHMTIQVGSFRDEANAKRLKMALELNHKNVYIMEANIGAIKYYRVRLGKFNDRNDAAGIGKALADEGYNVLITRFEQQI